MDNKTGKFILSLRQEKGLSQYQLAEMIPISRQAVSKWERGENIPDSYTLLKLSEMFNVTINELLLGERQLDNSVESLEKTTLNIVDESNKKTEKLKKIKRVLIIFSIIITALLLSFLSYYFISSYNTVEVYTISGASKSKKFHTNNGIFITTKEKFYIKISKIKYNKNIKIKSIQLSYTNNEGEIIMVQDKDVDNLNIKEYYGYSEKINKEDFKYMKKNLYLKIFYDDDQHKDEVDMIPLKLRRDFKNSNLFFTKKQKYKKEINHDNTSIKEVKDETKTQQEENKEEEKKEEEKKEETPVETPKTEETQPVVNQPKEEPKQVQADEPITIEKIAQKIKELGTYTDDGYYYEVKEGTKIINYLYQENLNQIMMIDLSSGDSWSYIGAAKMYSCAKEYNEEACRNIVMENAKEYLFKR